MALHNRRNEHSGEESPVRRPGFVL